MSILVGITSVSVRILLNFNGVKDDFRNGGSTDRIADILSYFESFSYYRNEQAETLEYLLTYFWHEFQRINDVTVCLSKTTVSVYTSHQTANPGSGFVDARINDRGEIHILVGQYPNVPFGTYFSIPMRQLKWENFFIKMREHTVPSLLGLRG